jgi:hypothetical protein
MNPDLVPKAMQAPGGAYFGPVEEGRPGFSKSFDGEGETVVYSRNTMVRGDR